MDLEEREGVEPLRQNCQVCGTRLTAAELQAALDGESDAFLCSRCAAEQVPVAEDFSEEA
jgi:recombinational DNA repair protein (RecF pathway)